MSVNSNNQILNGDFKHFYLGTDVAPDGWVLADGGSVAKESTIKPVGANSSLKVISDASGNRVYLSYHDDGVWELTQRGKIVTLSCMAYATAANTARIDLYNGSAQVASAYHSGVTGWELLVVTTTITDAADDVNAILYNMGDTTTVYFAQVMFNEGGSAFAFCPHVKDHLYEQTTLMVHPVSLRSGTSETSTRGDKGISVSYLYPEYQNGQMHLNMPIPTNVGGKPIVVDEATIYYWTDNSDEYIDACSIYSHDGSTGDAVSVVSNATNLGSGDTTTYGNNDILDGTPIELDPVKAYVLYITTAGMDAADDGVRIYTVKFKYHVKVHD